MRDSDVDRPHRHRRQGREQRDACLLKADIAPTGEAAQIYLP